MHFICCALVNQDTSKGCRFASKEKRNLILGKVTAILLKMQVLKRNFFIIIIVVSECDSAVYIMF